MYFKKKQEETNKEKEEKNKLKKLRRKKKKPAICKQTMGFVVNFVPEVCTVNTHIHTYTYAQINSQQSAGLTDRQAVLFVASFLLKFSLREKQFSALKLGRKNNFYSLVLRI